jgi:hypothetical protein
MTEMIADFEKGQKRLEEAMKERQKHMEDQIQRLKLMGTTMAMGEEFNKHIPWTVKELEEWLKGDVELLPVKPLVPTTTEAEVQKWWVDALKDFPGVKDTHAKGQLVGRDGVLHKPDLTMFVDSSTVWEKVDRIIELKTAIETPTNRRDVVIQLFSRMIEVLDHQPDQTVLYAVGLDHANVCFVRLERSVKDPLSRTLYVSDSFCVFDNKK